MHSYDKRDGNFKPMWTLTNIGRWTQLIIFGDRVQMFAKGAMDIPCYLRMPAAVCI